MFVPCTAGPPVFVENRFSRLALEDDADVFSYLSSELQEKVQNSEELRHLLRSQNKELKNKLLIPFFDVFNRLAIITPFLDPSIQLKKWIASLESIKAELDQEKLEKANFAPISFSRINLLKQCQNDLGPTQVEIYVSADLLFSCFHDHNKSHAGIKVYIVPKEGIDNEAAIDALFKKFKNSLWQFCKNQIAESLQKFIQQILLPEADVDSALTYVENEMKEKSKYTDLFSLFLKDNSCANSTVKFLDPQGDIGGTGVCTRYLCDFGPLSKEGLQLEIFTESHINQLKTENAVIQIPFLDGVNERTCVLPLIFNEFHQELHEQNDVLLKMAFPYCPSTMHTTSAKSLLQATCAYSVKELNLPKEKLYDEVLYLEEPDKEEPDKKEPDKEEPDKEEIYHEVLYPKPKSLAKRCFDYLENYMQKSAHDPFLALVFSWNCLILNEEAEAQALALQWIKKYLFLNAQEEIPAENITVNTLKVALRALFFSTTYRSYDQYALLSKDQLLYGCYRIETEDPLLQWDTLSAEQQDFFIKHFCLSFHFEKQQFDKLKKVVLRPTDLHSELLQNTYRSSKGAGHSQKIPAKKKKKRVKQGVAERENKSSAPQINEATNPPSFSLKEMIKREKRYFLVVACQKGNVHKVKELLIEMGKDSNEADVEGITPLIAATSKGHLPIVEMLIKYKADVNKPTKDGITALYYAAQLGYFEIVQLLLQKGAKIDVIAPNGMTPFLIAAQFGYLKIVDIFLQHKVKVNWANSEGITALLLAVENGHDAIVGRLLDKRAKIDIITEDGLTLLIVASNNGHTAVVKVLLQHGADVNQHGSKGWTPIIFAAHYGHHEIVELLVQNGAKIDGPSKNGETPLLFAAQSGHAAVVQVLLAYQAKIDPQTPNRATPLALAAQNGHKEVVAMLLQHGARNEITNQQGYTPLILASQNGHSKVVEVLLEYVKNVDQESSTGFSALLAAAQNGHTKVVKMLKEKGAKINRIHGCGATALVIACQNGRNETVKLLLMLGADVNLKDGRSHTPLFLAAQNGHIDTVKLLLKHRANKNIKNGNGILPRFIAIHQGHHAIAALL